ncbi:hypothetical protein Ga0466249_002238 [Sporomusaceae bacterium BoRhaA]|uniref:hypothetical protein n=1 Tax=Pelorhabdus rhamnosifermentans TaxID=2772457 RepID=UPI001C05F394|nr:hypothetical protein [Pelorhabdus rhamnosifermentans]MBU2701127.1 hypothetical protein [Pelorhabdus rhamnosifermentans]
MTESDIIKYLYAWHCKRGELFFPHVKTGSSWLYKGRQLRILDGLAIKISWTSPEFTGYEIKISRSDFLRDKKHNEYLPYCTGFSFVCPDKMIKKDEIEENIGLIYVKEDGSLRTAKKAPRLTPDVNTQNYLLRYLVYYRSGSNREQIMAAANQVSRERRRASEKERKARDFQDRFYELQNNYYNIPHEVRKQYEKES